MRPRHRLRDHRTVGDACGFAEARVAVTFVVRRKIDLMAIGYRFSGVTMATVLLLAGCAYNNPDAPVFTELARSNAMDAIAYSEKAGAALVVRVKYGKDMCSTSTVTLRKVVDGKIEGDAVVVDNSPRGFSNIAKGLAYAYSMENLKYGVGTGSSYRPIEPGRYVVVTIRCSLGQSEITFGNREWDLFDFHGHGLSKPVLGDNSITIEKGQIVDAGTLTILRLEGGLHYGTGFIVGSEAPESFRDAMRRQLPELAPKITYSRFSAATGLLTP